MEWPSLESETLQKVFHFNSLTTFPANRRAAASTSFREPGHDAGKRPMTPAIPRRSVIIDKRPEFRKVGIRFARLDPARRRFLGFAD
jgi:hypothetical protein